MSHMHSGSTLSRWIAVICLVGPLMVLTAQAKKDTSFTENNYFKLGTTLEEADKWLSDGDRWEIGFRVDTPSASRIACRLDGRLMFVTEFYMGMCCSVEKRVVCDAREAQAIFDYYRQLYGETPETTASADKELLYARWFTKTDEMELTIIEREEDVYMVMYEEFIPLLRGESRIVMERELKNTPVEIDPITGKPRPVRNRDQGDGEKAGEGEQGRDTEKGGEDKDNEDKDTEDTKDPPPPPVEDWWD